MKKKLLFKFVISLIIFQLLLLVAMYFFIKDYPYTALCISCFAMFSLYQGFAVCKEFIVLFNKVILSILSNDFSANLEKERTIDQSLYLLYHQSKNNFERNTAISQVYFQIFESLDTGILILKKENQEWNIVMMNEYFLRYFEVPKLTKWKYLKEKLPSFCKWIEKGNFAEIKTNVEIENHLIEKQTFLIQTSRTKIKHEEYYIILLDSIQKIVEKKENEAWLNLMKVISHELMNSLTPIKSLAKSNLQIISDQKIETEEMEDLKDSLQMIYERSEHLQFFVDNYRKVSMLPTPILKEVDLVTIIKNCHKLMQKEFIENDIEIEFEMPEKCILKLDINQIELVIINLMSNSIYALAEKLNKKIKISLKSNIKENLLILTDNGQGIDPMIQNKIFMPFFTTRKNGGGIGLALSKAIIEMHQGKIAFETTSEKTSFIIHFC